MIRAAVCWGILGLAWNAVAAEDGPLCALIDAAQLPVTGVLEAKLLAAEGGRWVERNEIARLLGERELQTAFGADGVGNRASLGKLLKADVLVLLRSAKNPNPKGSPLVDCVVCETRRGLRLESALVEGEADQEKVAAELEKIVRRGLRKHDEKAETIVAVSPFLSDDLGLEFNYLQAAFAKIVEQKLLTQPGLLVVELGEAQAISRELTIGGGDRLDPLTKPPVYVVGRYRNDGLGDKRRIQIGLRLMQSEQRLAEKDVDALPPGESSAWVFAQTAELLTVIQKTTASNVNVFSARNEARVIAERGRLFQRFGNWSEAHALFEASLLLQPDDLYVRRDVLNVIRLQIDALRPADRNLETAKRSIALGERGLQLLEALLLEVGDITRLKLHHGENFAVAFDFAMLGGLRTGPNTAPEIVELMSEARRKRRETLLRLAYTRGKAKIRDGDRYDLGNWDARAVAGLPDEERFAVVLRVAAEWSDLPDLEARLIRMTHGEAGLPKDTPAYRALLEHFDNSGRADLREAAEGIRKKTAEGIRAQQERMAKPNPPPEPTDIDPRLEPVEFRPFYSGEVFDGCVTTKPGVDVVWRNATILQIREPSVLNAFYKFYEDNLAISSVVYDGRWVWLAGKPGNNRPPVLLAVDDAGKAVEFNAEDGLPKTDVEQHEMRLAPISPGKICLIGYSGRSWIATAEIGADNGKKFKIIFEAREIVTQTDPKEAENPHSAFTPTRLLTFRSPGQRPTVYVGRKGSSGNVNQRPLLIDLESGAAKVASFTAPNGADGHDRYLVQSTDAVYFFEPNWPKAPNLFRSKYPFDTKEKFVSEAPDGFLAYDDRGLHVIGKKWWIADPNRGELRPLLEKTAWFYGPFIYTGNPEDKKYTPRDLQSATQLFQVLTTQHHGLLLKLRKGSKYSFMQLRRETPGDR